jgi:hypothetical protein
MSEKTILNDLELACTKGTVVAVGMALLYEEESLTVSHTL